jgi:hypothetical protein
LHDCWVNHTFWQDPIFGRLGDFGVNVQKASECRDATGTLLASLERRTPEGRIVCLAWSKRRESVGFSNKLTAERLGMN